MNMITNSFVIGNQLIKLVSGHMGPCLGKLLPVEIIVQVISN